MASDTYHGYASESDYHEHYTLLAELERTSDADERKNIEMRISEILAQRIYVEVRGPAR